MYNQIIRLIVLSLPMFLFPVLVQAENIYNNNTNKPDQAPTTISPDIQPLDVVKIPPINTPSSNSNKEEKIVKQVVSVETAPFEIPQPKPIKNRGSYSSLANQPSLQKKDTSINNNSTAPKEENEEEQNQDTPPKTAAPTGIYR